MSIRVEVDFGEALDPVLLPTLDVAGLVVGMAVEMYDEDGNTCQARVTRLDAHMAWLEPNWATWTSYGASSVWVSQPNEPTSQGVSTSLDTWSSEVAWDAIRAQGEPITKAGGNLVEAGSSV